MIYNNKILILDASSYIGGHLYNRLGRERALATHYKKPVSSTLYFDALNMNIADVIPDSSTFTHAVILTAIPNPDICAADTVKSRELNVDSVKKIVDYLNERDIIPVFTSTESVFDGQRGYYNESDDPNPVLTYGQQKVEVEKYIVDSGFKYIIVRLAKVFGSCRMDGTIFTSWLDQIEAGQVIYCARDQIFSPIHVSDVVECVIKLIETDSEGIFHVASCQAYSRLELLKILLTELGKNGAITAKIIPCSITDFELLEKRPLNVSMDPTLVQKVTGHSITSVTDAVRQMV